MGWPAVFVLAAVAVALTPGPNNLLGLHHGVHHGAGWAVLALGGRLAAFVIMITAVVAGLGPLLSASETALTVIKWAGVAYLLWVGVRMLVAGLRSPGPDGVSDDAAPVSPRALVRREFLTAITNPKAVLVFAAFVPQFVDPARGPVPLQLAVLGALYLAAELVAGTVYVLGGTVLRAARIGARARRRLDCGTGAVLVGMAGVLATSRS